MKRGFRKLRAVGGVTMGVLCLTGALCFISAGCDEAPDHSASVRERQDRAISDPMHYKPDFGDRHVSNGNTGTFDKKGFNDDLRDVLNP